MTTFARSYFRELRELLMRLDTEIVERCADLLVDLRQQGGRLFILGVGGSAANASHAVNDFRKMANIETYSPIDNVAELTARINDDGWLTVFKSWLTTSHLTNTDVLLVLSVGGGNTEYNVSPNIVSALVYAQEVGTKIIGIVGRDGGYTAKVATECIIVPTVNVDHVSVHAEVFQSIVCHLLVSHPKLNTQSAKWESLV